MLFPLAGGSGAVVTLGELVMILELHRQGLKVSAIARQTGLDRKTVRKYIARGLEPPIYGPRQPQQKSTAPFRSYSARAPRSLSRPDRRAALARVA